MRSAEQWFDEYSTSHRNPINKRIHWICVPVILFTVIALLWSLPAPDALSPLNWAVTAVAAAQLYYFLLSLRIGAGMLVVNGLCLVICYTVERYVPLWGLALVLFTAAWIGQFIGHHIEGRRPSFAKDVQFLLIGPAWLLDQLYRR